MEIITWIVFGLVVGLVAKFLMPGNDPGGLIVTILLGVVGALLGGWLSREFGINQGRDMSFLMSVVGGVIVLALYRSISSRRRRAFWPR